MPGQDEGWEKAMKWLYKSSLTYWKQDERMFLKHRFCFENRNLYICTNGVMKLIQRHISQIAALCEKHKVASLYVFGSVLTDRFNNESDIDFVVIFDKAGVDDYFDNYFDFKYALQDLLGREVDLVEDQTIRNKYLRQNVDASKQLIYG